MSREMNRAKVVALRQGPVRKLLVAGGGDLAHLVGFDEEGRTLCHAQLAADELEALLRALEEMREGTAS